MVHTRIRPFNTLGASSEEDRGADLAHAVVAGNIVFLRGQVGQDLQTGESVGIGDAAVQVDCAMRNAEILLKECGSDLGHICKIVIYLVDPRLRDAVYPVVSMLGRPEWLVEVDLIAVKPEAAEPSGRRATHRR
jgi:enamine deaminase RidA (YjgF/YER057c/UK114 family)